MIEENKNEMIEQFLKIGEMWPGSKNDVLSGICICVTGVLEAMEKNNM